ncbi:DUF2726 domain-containing protein [Photobacterium kishitanii]|uniref:DUF2726 domain-containing protein n=1 Tax=Photobacterium kishitanii TaxID=318456 RepID=A0A2T3KA62_9GAMM|nr:DUF2726 domain-containing protein [Photobacterium kishitanii]PSU88133.1 hypothetical protein C9J27_25715 [Photobacterium kishitanii]
MEKFYNLLASQSWAEILGLVKSEQAVLKNNGMEWETISNLLESEFIQYARKEKAVLISRLCADYIKLCVSGYISVSNTGLKQIESIGFSASLSQSESEAAAFSRLCSYDETALNFEKTSVKNINFEKYSKKTKFARTDWLMPLFKSNQELIFNQALKDVFPTYFIYPNVAVSNLFDFDLIKTHLSSFEREYFFKAIIDFVVYDPIDYTPKFFFEVDSVFHDSAEARIRDNKKNKIFEVAGIKLNRVRISSETLTEKYDFIKEIRKITA